MILLLLGLALAQEPEFTAPVPTDDLVIAWPGEAGDDERYIASVDLTVAVDGSVSEVTLVSGEEPFASALLAAAADLTFEPAREDGRPVEVVVPLSWTFEQPPVNVSGLVRVAGVRSPAQGVQLVVGERSIRTDDKGEFAVRGVPLGPVTVRLAESNYRMEPLTIELLADQRADVQLWIVEERWGNEVVGTYTRERPVTTVMQLERDAIRESPGALGDPVRALQNLPGLARTPLDAGWLLVRGGFPEDTPVFLDGVQIPALYHLGGLTSILHPESVERIALYPGSTPARLGRGLSGAAEMTSRRLTGDLHVFGGVNVAFAHLFAEAPLGEEGGFSIAGRRSYLDGVLTAVLDAERARIAPRFWDAQARIDTPNAGLIVTGMWDAANFPAEEVGEEDAAGQRSIVAQGRLEGDVGDVHLDVRPWVTVNSTDFEGFRNESILEVAPGARVEASGEHSDLSWLIGAEAQYRDWRIERVTQTDGGSQTENAESGATYLDPYAELSGGTSRAQFRAGLRLDTLFIPGHFARAGLSPRIDGRLRISDTSALTASAWQTHQEPPSLFLLGFPDGPFLSLERSRGMSGGINTAQQQWGGELQVWARDLDEVTGFENDGTLQGYEMRAAGFETSGWAQLGRLRTELIYQFTQSDARAERGDGYRAIRYEQPHRVVALMGWDLPKDWRLGGRWRYASGVPIPSAQISAFDFLAGEERITEASPSGRLPAYHGLDVRVSKRFTFRSWKLSAYVDVQNVYNRRIVEPAINGIDETLVVYGYGLPVLPLFGIDAEVRRKRK